jgi:hypothetical protein
VCCFRVTAPRTEATFTACAARKLNSERRFSLIYSTSYSRVACKDSSTHIWRLGTLVFMFLVWRAQMKARSVIRLLLAHVGLHVPCVTCTTEGTFRHTVTALLLAHVGLLSPTLQNAFRFDLAEGSELKKCIAKNEEKKTVFWDVTPCGSCKNRRFGGTQHHHQGDKNRISRNYHISSQLASVAS